ncbi:MAG: hypothetical protein LQ351_007053 [Letrouitia transgressa]|nr:MAG: hypothetical protein LQ351_007053 [Letrouitia transgressa]
MATSGWAPQSNGYSNPVEPSPDSRLYKSYEYQKIIKLRNDIFAHNHPRLRLLSQNERLPNQSTQPLHTPEAAKGISQHAFRIQTEPSQVRDKSNISPSQLSKATPLDPTVLSSSAIDPVLLTKSEVLVKAELQQKRQRLERMLEEQLKNKETLSKPTSFDQDAWPDLDIDDVLRKAQELVKPSQPAESNVTNLIASSSDSFDENTFYSSQMNDSTSEEADRPPKRVRIKPMCKYFLDGIDCPYGESCTFSHDPGQKQKLEGESVKAKDSESFGNDKPNKQARSNPQSIPQQLSASGEGDEKPMSKAERITRLEVQLRALRSEKEDDLNHTGQNRARENHDAYEESAYSPPDAIPPKQNWTNRQNPASAEKPNKQRTGLGRRPLSVEREYGRREVPPSPFANDGKVIRNHITSPLAPQPARVSPLAVAKVSRISQPQSNRLDTDHPSRDSVGTTSPVQSPRGRVHTLNPRKRRRVRSPGEKVRSVMPRRTADSPIVRVKDEPMSPPPYPRALRVWQPHEEPVFTGSTSSQHRDQDGIIYEPRNIYSQRPMNIYSENELTSSRQGHSIAPVYQPYSVYEEPELRRVVSMRQARLVEPLPPGRLSPHVSSARAASQVYIPRQDPEFSRQYRASVHPVTHPHVNHEHTPSPVYREAGTSPTFIEPVAMAPPARRIIMDQHGNRFIETPPDRERQPSLVPVDRQLGYAQPLITPARRPSPARDPVPLRSTNEPRMVYREGSPAPPQAVDFYPHSVPTPINRTMGMAYSDERDVRHDGDVRLVDYREPRGDARPIERVARVPSVRPAGKHQDVFPEYVPRESSVRPERGRMISLNSGREMVRPVGRPVSVRPGETYARPVEYVPASKHQIYSAFGGREGQYAEDMPFQTSTYEAPLRVERRPAQPL